MELLERFINYVKIDTQSDEVSVTTPSTMKQYDLLNLLKKELEDLGVKAELDQYGRLYAKVNGNPKLDTIGFCSHVDTALECSGKNVNPQVIRNYDLKDIPLGKSGLYLSNKEFNKLKELKGKTLITTDGTTLLGADDKAGVAIIMTALEKYLTLEENKRHPMAILFTPDEEIGRGPEHFDPVKYGAKYAYTIDGADPKYISIENFNAKSALVEVKGKAIHPGDAKNKMVNAITVLNEFINNLPKDMVPEKTELREGFNHITSISGSVEEAKATYILRNHDMDILNKQVEDFETAKEKTMQKFPKSSITITFKDQYRNMKEIIDKCPEVTRKAEEAYKKVGINFEYEPTRGGTDGATFSFLGTPCPNLGTGSYNHHGKFEFACLEEMEQMVDLIIAIIRED